MRGNGKRRKHAAVEYRVKKGLVGPTGARGACDRPRRGDNYELVSRHVCEIVLVIVRVRQPLGPDKSKSNSTLTNNTIIDQTLPR